MTTLSFRDFVDAIQKQEKTNKSKKIVKEANNPDHSAIERLTQRMLKGQKEYIEASAFLLKRIGESKTLIDDYKEFDITLSMLDKKQKELTIKMKELSDMFGDIL